MKIKLRLLSLALSLLLLLSLCSCDLSFLSGLLSDGKDDFTPTEITEVVASSFDDCYGDQLSPNEKAIYEAIAAAKAGDTAFAVTLPEPLTLCKDRAPTDEEQDEAKEKLTYWISNAIFAVWLDTPSLFWLDFSDYSYSCTFKQNDEGVVGVVDLTVTVSSKMEAAAAVSRAAALEARLAALTPNGADDAALVRSINALLCDAAVYDLNAPDRGTAAGALVDGKCVCEGYARAFQLMCEKAGIDSVCILGDSTANGKTEGHMWNAVRIDGVWYYCDPTWNDTTESDKYLLVGGATPGHEGTFDATHTPEKSLGQSKLFALPAVSRTAYGEN